ncbi:hypothetical protein WH91_10265 [Devosia psychrophila]|uniref:Uncharacterized protein n=1 Tax=Devosia psychrophila TaxID=728005 RepID=A0ABR5DYI2_9HYPH|nr:hypothetical protein WH91_10265 [Devosia psychrophila]
MDCGDGFEQCTIWPSAGLGGFRLNVPACAAPVLFGMIGAATAAGSAVAGFSMMHAEEAI